MSSIHGTVRTARAWLALALIAALSLALLAGLLYSVFAALSRDTSSPVAPSARQSVDAPAGGPAARSNTGVDQRDELAARPMLQLAPSAARPQPLVAATAGPPISLPGATSTSDLVATGYPRTPEGALAQLAAIDALALHDLDPVQLRRVHDWATLPGAVPLTEWTPFVAASAALNAADVPDGAADLSSAFTPVAGQIKGVVADDFVVACVLGEWSVAYRATSRAGAADCQRMVWSGRRWWIGPGEQPAYAPSAWPGSADAVRAGWRELADA